MPNIVIWLAPGIWYLALRFLLSCVHGSKLSDDMDKQAHEGAPVAAAGVTWLVLLLSDFLINT